MSNVFVIDSDYTPLNPVHPGHARRLLRQGKAAVFRRYPFTLVLKRIVEQPEVQPLRLKLDPGSKTTGIALVNDANGKIVFAAELEHRGHAIKDSLDDRRAVRRSRRHRKTRYRKPRFHNRRKKKGWLPPSLESRLANILTWVARLCRYAPIAAISQELVKFDMQLMENPDIAGVEYQQGTLQGYEVREYLLFKWERKCAYCGKQDVPLQVEHIQARANDGTNRVSNLTLACEPCNTAKGTQDIEVFLKKKPDVLKRILAQIKKPLKDASAVNATRFALLERLKAVDLPVECGSGGLTKFNRTMRKLPKTHWLDAACVGTSTPVALLNKGTVPLHITATGHGRRQICSTDKYGFPKQHKERKKKFLGYQTGDMVKAITPKGTFEGRIAIRHRPSFRLGKADIHPKYMRCVHRSDGYEYRQKGVRHAPPPWLKPGAPAWRDFKGGQWRLRFHALPGRPSAL
ncbi:RNA-guided endonuclease IscB [Ktedonobacter racemifer]|uniref:HNH endonuclease n=1 Tax=Ktedonobacter racemifer DSM 44963 TaxID=485913 RepID=D6TD05_KTERA|nr:RNA-guided endonuclease IscB [Ktedonobacter racemifer]EFH90056.1 HNH endonuclease [Ktedonobacter racemifer DSM 44963]